jgi:DNA-binding response OmpR family regulator
VREKPFDLILLDLMLPDGSGYSVLEKLSKSNKAPVIVISSNDTARAAREAFKNGAVDYICKPFDAHELISIVEENIHG